MNAYCTPDSSPTSNHENEMTQSPMDYRRSASPPMVLDLCVRRSSPIPVATPNNTPVFTPSPTYAPPTFPTPPFNTYTPPTTIPSGYIIPKPEVSINSPDSSDKRIPNILPDTTIPQPTMLLTNHRSYKTARPFKAYPKDPTVLSTGGRTHSEALLNMESRESYAQFRHLMLAQVNNNNTVNSTVSNPKMRRQSRSNSHDSSGHENTEKDAAYWEKRRKNNEAAKRSRDARRAKEDEIAIRAAFLEHENMRLKIECAALREEITELRALIV